jgi:hypothetical protein
MSAVYYKLRDGSVTHDKNKYLLLVKDESYTLVRHHLCDRFVAKVVWSGGPFATSVPTEHCRPFLFRVWNMIESDEEHGGMKRIVHAVPDPTESKEFRTEKEAIDAYEYFLSKNGGGEWVTGHTGESVFVERGNKVMQITPDTPTGARSEAEEVSNEEIGSW